MEQYLIQLIRDNNRVIIPEIGALIARNKDPLEIGFNGVLSFNDGLLTGHIIQTEDVTFKEANDKVMAYKDELLDQLNKKGEVILKDIGKITIDAAGNRSFVGLGKTAKEAGKAVAEAEAKKKADEEKTKAEAEAKKKADEEKTKAEAEAKKKADEEKTKAEAEAKKKADEEKTKAEAEAKKTAPVKDSVEKTAFTLDESLSDVDVDATQDITDIKAAKEDAKSKPSFTLDESDQITREEAAGVPKEQDVQDTAEPKEETEPETKTEATPAAEKPGPKYIVRESRTPRQPPPPPMKEKKAAAAPSRNKRRIWIIPVVIIFLLIIALIAGYFFFPEQLNRILPEKIASILPERGQPLEEPAGEEPAEAVEEGSVVEESAEALEEVEHTPPETEETAEMIEEPVQEEPAKATPAEVTAGKQYYIVAGCFENRANADWYVTELRQAGYNARIFGTRLGNLHAVCFDSFSTKSEALAEMRRIRQEKEPNAWVLYY